jgi:polar amino acid transport system substrate-binding protein
VNTRWLPVVLIALALAPPAFGQQRKYLRWGGDQVGGGPYIYKEPGDKPVNPDDEFDEQNFRGFEIELARYLAKEVGRESEFVPGDWDKLPELLKQKVTDDKGIDIVLNGYELREDLNKEYPATVPYYAYRLSLVINKENAGTIRKWGDLSAGISEDGKVRKVKVGVLNASAAHQYMKNRYGDKIDLLINPDVATVIGLVEKRQSMDATVQDSPAAHFYVSRSQTLQEVGEPQKPGYYVIYTRPEDRELRDKLNEAIKKGLKDGSLRKIYRKYGLWNADQDWLCKEVTGEFPNDDDEDVPTATETGTVDWGRLLRELLKAAGMTIFLSVVSFPIAMAIGMLVALGRVYGPLAVRFPLGLYVEFLRGTPLLLQLYFVFYLLPQLIPGFNLSPIQAGIIGLAINYSAYEAENYRAGLLAIPRGQMEAALALGMNPFTALRVVIVPQAVRIVIPPVTNDFIALFKDTSVCSVILITELTRKYNELYNFNREYIIQLAFITAGLYLIMSYPLALVARVLEKRMGSVGGAHR